MALTTPHEYHDEAHLAEIVESIRANGWQGAPLVTFGKQLLSGTHRYLACKRLGIKESAIPTVTIAAVFAEAGLDFRAVCEEMGVKPQGIRSQFPSDRAQTLADYITYVQPELPAAIVAKYGLDME
jgi:hypothetical protein